MSDTEKAISADEADDQQELTKEERLEAARKKFEEMKKKKKKSKKKKKEDSKENTQEPEDKTEGDADEPKTETEETPAPEAEKADVVPEIEEKAPEVEDKAPEAAKIAEKVPEPVAEPAAVSAADNAEVLELQAKVEDQAKTIAKLRDENTDLKLSRMDLQDKIEELEHQLALLKSNSSTSVPPPPAVVTSPLKPAKPVITTNDYASVSQQNFKKFETTVDFRERLMIWKGWQVDMSNWNGTNIVTKVAI